MASAKGMQHQNRKTAQLLCVSEAERPCAVQLFGSEPSSMADAAALAQSFRPDAIDINMGCPAPKVTGTGSGSALMKTPDLAAQIIRQVRAAATLPLSVKIRAGWDAQNKNAIELAQLAQQNGADAIIVHGRTRQQMYAPPVDYKIIAEVKKAVEIPVIGNGDVCDIESAQRMYETGCDLVMVGRGARGAPWVFRILRDYFEHGIRTPQPPIEERLDIMLRHIRLTCLYKGESVAMREARKHVAWYCKGWHGAAMLRQKAGSLSRFEELEALAKTVLEGNARSGR